MCEYCNDTGLIYADRGIGIEVKKCPVCDNKNDSFKEFQKRLREIEKRLQEQGA